MGRCIGAVRVGSPDGSDELGSLPSGRLVPGKQVPVIRKTAARKYLAAVFALLDCAEMPLAIATKVRPSIRVKCAVTIGAKISPLA